jgi:Mg/Co/Ni transporter MgtE
MEQENSKKQKLKDFNLTKDQKSKIKEQRQSAITKKAAIESDNKLSADEKAAKLKELKTEEAKNVMSILNDEQKQKMKKTMKAKREKKKTEEENK